MPGPTRQPIASLPMQVAYRGFLHKYPQYEATLALDELRLRDFRRLDRTGHVYLDYTGAGLYGESQLRKHISLLRSNVFGNPHSHNPTSLAMTRLVDRARQSVLDFFNAPAAEYTAIFTANASAALKLVGEAYPFAQGASYMLLYDNHNSVNGIREYARARGANVTYLPVTMPELRLDPATFEQGLCVLRLGTPGLFAFPAQSNFSGVQHPLEMIDKAHHAGWDVLVDCAAFAPTNHLDIARWQPDFVPLSFYKMFGYPTGVGCLIARRAALARLQRPWFAGGTIRIASVQGDGYYLVEGEAGFEDGTINFLNLPAVEIGLQYLASTGMEIIHTRVMCLTGWLLENLHALRHANGAPLVNIHGPADTHMRGGTIAFDLLDPARRVYDVRRIEELANHENISLRSGCFCNPGAGEVAHALDEATMRSFFSSPQGMDFSELRCQMLNIYGKEYSSLRISTGLASNFSDVQRFLQFVGQLVDQSAEDIGKASSEPPCEGYGRDAA